MTYAHPSQIQCANLKLYMCATSLETSALKARMSPNNNLIRGLSRPPACLAASGRPDPCRAINIRALRQQQQARRRAATNDAGRAEREAAVDARVAQLRDAEEQ